MSSSKKLICKGTLRQGQHFTKLGRKYQYYLLYLQSINSDKYLPQSPFTGKFFRWRHFVWCLYSYLVHGENLPEFPSRELNSGLYSQHYYILSLHRFLCEVHKWLNFSAKRVERTDASFFLWDWRMHKIDAHLTAHSCSFLCCTSVNKTTNMY